MANEQHASTSSWSLSSLLSSRASNQPTSKPKADELYNAAVLNTSEDFSDLDMMGFIVTGSLDKQKRPAVFVISKFYQAAVMNPDRLFRYLVHKLHALTQQEYVLVWVHTNSTYWENCPSAQWLWRTYEQLPVQYRDNLHCMYVVHCDMLMWMGMWAVCPWMSQRLWRKVEWVSRLEFLWEFIDKSSAGVPDFVKEHDKILEEHPLLDYGIVANKETMMPSPVPFPLR